MSTIGNSPPTPDSNTPLNSDVWRRWLARLRDKLNTVLIAPVSLTTEVTGTLPATNGGTGIASYAVGDILYANTTTTLAKRAAVADGQILGSAGIGVAPAYRTLASRGFAIDYSNLGVAPIVAAGTDGIAIGDSASVGAGATNSIAIGQGASVGATFTNSTALGAGAVAGASNVVAIGNATN